MPLLFILHLPTLQQLQRYGLYERMSRNTRIELRPRYSYFDFAALLHRTEFVVTDGGSIQEEASYLGIPCLLMRNRTERQEGVGANVYFSELDMKCIDTFLTQYPELSVTLQQPATLPSDIIIEALHEFAIGSSE
jgi:UDP-N-acetylglucosamine 2-epimerase (non-hydrolysing)